MIAPIRRSSSSGLGARAGDDGGSLTPAAIFFIVALFMFAGLSLDFWSLISERRALAEAADSSARAGANGVDLDHYDATGDVQLDPGLAQQLAADHLAGQDAEVVRSLRDANVSADTAQVVVEIIGEVDLLLLRLAAIDTFEMRVESVAEPRLGSAGAGGGG